MNLWTQDVSQHSILLKLRWGPSYHLYMDTASNARLRARFRHNRVANNFAASHHLTPNVLLISHPYCPLCPTTPETVQHMIEECPLYDAPRLQLKWQLQQQLQITSNITVQLVLGIHIRPIEWNDRAQRGQTRLMLLYTATFLRYICCLRLLGLP